MSRYISKLPPLIRELAEKRRSEQNPISKNDELAGAFDFTRTKEGFEFWMNINYERYQPFFTLYPKKDKLDELIEWLYEMFDESKQNNDDKLYLKGIFDCISKAKEIKNGK